MLSAKPWKADALIRLMLSVIICIYAGSVVGSILRYGGAGAKVSSRLFYPLAALALIGLGGTLVLVHKPWRLETIRLRLVLLLICAYGGLFLGAWAQHYAGTGAQDASIGHMILATLSFQGASLILIARFLRDQRVSWAEGFGLTNHRRQALLLGLLAAVIFLPLGWALQQVSALAMTHLPFWHGEPQEQLPVHALRISVSWGGRLALGAVAILLAPVAEEMLFRGILYPAIKQAGFPRLALWGTSLLFAAVHMNAVTFLPLAVLALLLTGLYEWTNNLLASIAAHVLFNTLNFAALLLIQRYWGV